MLPHDLTKPNTFYFSVFLVLYKYVFLILCNMFLLLYFRFCLYEPVTACFMLLFEIFANKILKYRCSRMLWILNYIYLCNGRCIITGMWKPLFLFLLDFLIDLGHRVLFSGYRLSYMACSCLFLIWMLFKNIEYFMSLCVILAQRKCRSSLNHSNFGMCAAKLQSSLATV